MKKFTVIFRDSAGALTEQTVFAEQQKEVKGLENFVAILKSERVKHPSPEVLQRVLAAYQIKKIEVNAARFYEDCAKVAEMLDGREEVVEDSEI